MFESISSQPKGKKQSRLDSAALVFNHPGRIINFDFKTVYMTGFELWAFVFSDQVIFTLLRFLRGNLKSTDCTFFPHLNWHNVSISLSKKWNQIWIKTGENEKNYFPSSNICLSQPEWDEPLTTLSLFPWKVPSRTTFLGSSISNFHG